MSHKRKRDDEAGDGSEDHTVTEPLLKRAKTSLVHLPTNADALGLIMAEADLATATVVAMTCKAAQQVWNDVNSFFWYSQAKAVLPGLSGRSLTVNYKTLVEELGLAAVGRSFVSGANIFDALLLPASGSLESAIDTLAGLDRRLGNLHRAVGAVDATFHARLTVEKQPPRVISNDASHEFDEEIDADGTKSADMTLYRRMAFRTAPLIAAENCLEEDDYPVWARQVFASIVVYSPAGDRHCCFDLSYDDMRSGYEPSIIPEENFMFFKLDSDPSYSMLDKSLRPIANWESLFGESVPKMDSVTAQKILAALGVNYTNVEGAKDEETALRWSWDAFYRRLVAFMCVKSFTGPTHPAAAPEPNESTAEAQAASVINSRAEYIANYEDSLQKLLRSDAGDAVQRSAAASLALRHVFCLRRLAETLRNVALALEGKDESVISPALASSGSSQATDASKAHEEASPFLILDVASAAIAKDIIAAENLPFGTGCAFYEVLKSESVSKTKQIVVYSTSTNKWLENDEARVAIGAPVGSDSKIGPKEGFRIFVQSTSPNRKIPAGSGLLYKGEAAIQRNKDKNQQKRKKRTRGDDDDGGDGDDDEGDGGEDDDGERRPRADGEYRLKSIDISQRGNLSLLSFFGASGAQRQAILDFCNSMWIISLEENLSYEDNCGICAGDDLVNVDFHFAAVLRAGIAPGSSVKFGAAFMCEIHAEDEDLGPERWIWNVKRKGHTQDVCIDTLPEQDSGLTALGSAPTEIALLATTFFGLFEKAEALADGTRRFMCPGKFGLVKLSVVRRVLKRRLIEIISKKSLAHLSMLILN